MGFDKSDERFRISMLRSSLNYYEEGVRTRIIMVTPCQVVQSEITYALGMALHIDRAFFTEAIGCFRRIGADPIARVPVPTTLEVLKIEEVLHTQVLQV